MAERGPTEPRTRRRARPGPRPDPRRPRARRRPRASGGRGGRGGRPGQVSGSHPDDRDPQLLGAMVDKLVGDQGWELELRVRGVFARWPELVGDEVAAHTHPETFTDGKLVVRTDSTAWATQLKLLTPDLLRRLNEELGTAR